MQGTTLHTGGDIGVGGQHKTQLVHGDIDGLFTRNQHLRWVLIDEVGMIPDDLLGAFTCHFADAAAETRFKYRADKTVRPLGGYNFLVFGDVFQIPPIPSTTSITIPPQEKKSERALQALHLFWGDDADALNYFAELTIQKRIDDPWYAAVMDECRYGRLSTESYNFLHGLPTRHAGSWNADGTLACKTAHCRELPDAWARMAAEGHAWSAMQALECAICTRERDRRNRALEAEDPRVHLEPFLSAPFIHKNNEPKYHAMLLRAAEQAKRTRKYILWFAAVDHPENPAQIVKTPGKLKQRLERFLQFHDQQTAGIPGLNVLYVGLQSRVTEKIVKRRGLIILKHTPCTVIGWDLHAADRQRKDGAERFLDYLPLCIYVRFEEAAWVVHPRLGPGVLPLYPVDRTWTLNEASGAKIRRRGFTLLPDCANTAFMIQGSNLVASIADCGDITDLPGLPEAMTTCHLVQGQDCRRSAASARVLPRTLRYGPGARSLSLPEVLARPVPPEHPGAARTLHCGGRRGGVRRLVAEV